jgi:hypothetical protein
VLCLGICELVYFGSRSHRRGERRRHGSSGSAPLRSSSSSNAPNTRPSYT